MRKFGVLAIQGSVIEHIIALNKLDGILGCEVRTIEELKDVDGLIVPGGESTTISKLLFDFGLVLPIKERVREGMPIWGTCAGMILLASKILEGERPCLDLLDVCVRRNAYGSQLESFTTQGIIPKVSKNSLELVFIRAPWIESYGNKVEVLARNDERVVAVQQGKILATSFHPELTNNLEFHRYFVNM